MPIISFVLLGAAFLIFAVVIAYGIRLRHKICKELSFEKGIYGGPAGEPIWDGVLPKKVDDFVKPRYVYENLVESTEYLPENGRIIGYRISPCLVIHSRVRAKINYAMLYSYIERFGGKLLSKYAQKKQQLTKLLFFILLKLAVFTAAAIIQR